MDDAQPPRPDSDDLQRLLNGAHALIHALPEQERRIATAAAEGRPVWEIAQETGIGESAVWRTLDGVIAAATGREMTPVETGGLGSDTDPGVTGGYGDTGFGALDTEPIPDNREPDEM